MMTQIENVEWMRKKLKERQKQMSRTAFGNVTRKLSEGAEDVLWRVLAGNTVQEIVDAVAWRYFHQGESANLTEAELGAAEVKTRCLLSEIEDRFQIV